MASQRAAAVFLDRGERDSPHRVPRHEPGRGQKNEAGAEAKPGTAPPRLKEKRAVRKREEARKEPGRDVFGQAELRKPVRDAVASLVRKVVGQRPEGAEPSSSVSQEGRSGEDSGRDDEPQVR